MPEISICRSGGEGLTVAGRMCVCFAAVTAAEGRRRRRATRSQSRADTPRQRRRKKRRGSEAQTSLADYASQYRRRNLHPSIRDSHFLSGPLGPLAPNTVLSVLVMTRQGEPSSLPKCQHSPLTDPQCSLPQEPQQPPRPSHNNPITAHPFFLVPVSLFCPRSQPLEALFLKQCFPLSTSVIAYVKLLPPPNPHLRHCPLSFQPLPLQRKEKLFDRVPRPAGPAGPAAPLCLLGPGCALGEPPAQCGRE